jgi:hypothetical protein
MLPDTSAQRAVVHRYLVLLSEERYADAWELLTPERQWEQSVEEFTAAWKERGRVVVNDYADPLPALVVWPAARDEMRAHLKLQRAQDITVLPGSFMLRQFGADWRIASEHVRESLPVDAPPPKQSPARSPLEAARRAVERSYGPIWLPSVSILYDQPYADGRVVIVRALLPFLSPEEETPQLAAILHFLRPENSGWRFDGGGAIGTIVVMGRLAVPCAWTWLRFPTSSAPDATATAAFYCTIEDPRVASIELGRVDGAVQRKDVAGQQAVVFPYPWPWGGHWPEQHPRAIRLFDAAGRPLDLTTTPTSVVPSGRDSLSPAHRISPRA